MSANEIIMLCIKKRKEIADVIHRLLFNVYFSSLVGIRSSQKKECHLHTAKYLKKNYFKTT